MRLWTIQHINAYENLLKYEVLTANEDYFSLESDFRQAYDWMARRMRDKGIISPVSVNYPLWAWYQWEGKRKRPDMRQKGYASRGEKIALLTIEINEKDCLLTDFDLFHFVLNYWYLPNDEKNGDEFENLYESLGFSWHDLQDISITSDEMKKLRAIIESSWERVFDLESEDEGYIFGKNSAKSIQATFWELHLSQVVKAEFFTAR